MKARIVRVLKEAVWFVAAVGAVSVVVDMWRTPEHTVEKLSHTTWRTIEGKRVSLRNGKATILFFWMPHCPVCKLDMPAAKAVAKRYRVISVAAFASREEVRRARKRYGIDFPVVWDENGTISARFGVKAFPMFFIYDASGKLRYVTSGYTTQAGLSARLKLAERSEGHNPR